MLTADRGCDTGRLPAYARSPRVRPHAGALPSPMILLASPSPTARCRWRQALAVPVREIATPRALARALAETPTPVVLLDVALGLRGGAAAVARLVRRHAGTAVIVVTARPTEREGVAMLRAGARGYCPRALEPALLRRAVDVVQRGEVWASRMLVARLVDALGAAMRARQDLAAARPHARLARLTAREREIAMLVGAGAANKEIAHRLDVTERTVKAHLTAIFRKLGIADRLRLALALNGTAARALTPRLDDRLPR
jgi:two-component system, NarL family, nitrate/nitrite response regulator NarL